MGIYKELMEEWSLTDSTTGMSGHRVLVPGGSLSLPAKGTLFPADEAGEFIDSSGGTSAVLPRLLSIRKVPRACGFAFELDYGVSQRSGPISDGTAGQNEQLEAGGELLALENDGVKGWKWPSGAVLDVPIGLKIITAKWSFENEYASLNAALAHGGGTLGPFFGKINSGGDKPGCWLFLGVSVMKGFNTDGTVKYIGTRQYGFKLVWYGGSPVSFLGWNYLWNKITEKFERPYKDDGSGATYMYESATLPDQDNLPVM